MDNTNFVSLDHVENRFLFVLVAAKRALQLQKGAKPRVELGTKKPTVLAMSEVLDSKVQYQLPNQNPKKKKSHK